MSGNLADLNEDRLKDLLAQSAETIEAVCDRLEQDLDMTEGIRQLMKSNDMLAALRDIERENRQNAALILNAAIAVLVNSQSILAINLENQRRKLELN
jgi:hypothetical protein